MVHEDIFRNRFVEIKLGNERVDDISYIIFFRVTRKIGIIPPILTRTKKEDLHTALSAFAVNCNYISFTKGRWVYTSTCTADL